MTLMQLFPPFCPACREGLTRDGDSFTCSKCGRVYPSKGGLVDFLTSMPLSDAQQVVQRTFDANSASYDDAIVRLVEGQGCPWSAYTARVEAFLAEAGGKLILDIGCGTAFPVGSFIPDSSIYVGLDVSLEMLGHARALLGERLNVALWNVAAERVPLPDTCVDVCLALLAFNAFPDPQKAADEIRRVIKRDGTVFGTVFVQQPPEDFFSERPIDPSLVRQLLSVFDPSSWKLTTETLGGILFFTLRRSR
jgi:ubiquinone/menaquinone biosynthesis C-methylase UbiE